MRTVYNNGSEISLRHNGCDGCSPAMVNSTLSHEHGCPDAWRDYTIECAECGEDVLRENRHQLYCLDCQRDAQRAALEDAMDDAFTFQHGFDEY